MIRLANEVTVEVVPPEEEFDIEVEVGGGSAVAAVNGKTGNVHLTAVDVGADPAGAAASALQAAKTYAETILAGGSGAGFARAAYIHVQSMPSSEWLVDHNRNGYPSVTVLDSSGEKVEPTIVYLNLSQLLVRAGAPFGGTAYVI